MEIVKNYYIKNKIRKNFKALDNYNKLLNNELTKVGCIVDMDFVKDVNPLLGLLTLLLLSSSIRAKLRIGFQGIDLQYNDIVIGCTPNQETVFVNEVKKVLSTIIHK